MPRRPPASAIRRRLMVAVAALWPLVFAVAARGQSTAALPDHRIIARDSVAGTCLVALVPHRRTSDAAPELVVRAGGGDGIAFAFEAGAADPAGEVQFVALNVRGAFEPMPITTPAALETRALWRRLMTLHEKKAPFFLTARDAGGEWASSRYEAPDPAGILRLLDAVCGLNTKKPPPAMASDADEKALNLDAEQVRHIRWLLTRRYDPAGDAPGPSATFSATERRYIERYAKSVGLPGAGFLSRELADRLLAEPFVPRRENYAGLARVKRLGDWVGYQNMYEGCVIATEAQAWHGDMLYSAPHMRFAALPATDDGRLLFDLVVPNPFRGTSPAWATVDGERFNLDAADDVVKPAPGGVGRRLMVAIRAGSSVEITGTGRTSGKPLTIAFSANGFTAAFRHLIRECGSPSLEAWIR